MIFKKRILVIMAVAFSTPCKPAELACNASLALHNQLLDELTAIGQNNPTLVETAKTLSHAVVSQAQICGLYDGHDQGYDQGYTRGYNAARNGLVEIPFIILIPTVVCAAYATCQIGRYTYYYCKRKNRKRTESSV